jgi:CBS domain-containing protein
MTPKAFSSGNFTGKLVKAVNKASGRNRSKSIAPPIFSLFPWVVYRGSTAVDEDQELIDEASILAFRQVDFTPVVRGGTVTGIIGGREIIRVLVQIRERGVGFLLGTKATEIMDRNKVGVLGLKDSLPSLLALMSKIKFGNVCIVEDGKLVATVSLRDVISYVAGLHIDTGLKVADLANPGITLPHDATLSQLLDQMVTNDVRRVLVKGLGRPKVADDRMIIQYAFGEEGLTALARNYASLFDRRLEDLPLQEPGVVNGDADVAEAWRAAHAAPTACVLLDEQRILTPWDLVIRVHALGRFPGARRSFEDVVAISFETEVKGILGETVSEALFHTLQTDFEIKSNDIYGRAEEIPIALTQVLGRAGAAVQRNFLRRLYADLRIPSRPPDSFKEALEYSKEHFERLGPAENLS